MPKVTLTDITSGYDSASAYNANNDRIEAGFDNTLSRDGTSPNQMGADLDMNSNAILNAGITRTSQLYINGTLATTGALTASNKTVHTATATAGQTLFTGLPTYVQGTNTLDVYVNGVHQSPASWTETSTTSITFSEGLEAGDAVVIVLTGFTELNTVSASNVGYTPAGTGAVTTNVQDKLREFVSVKDFGADPFNTAEENNVAISKAAAIGKSLHVPAGEHLVTLPQIRANLYGEGTIKTATQTLYDGSITEALMRLALANDREVRVIGGYAGGIRPSSIRLVDNVYTVNKHIGGDDWLEVTLTNSGTVGGFDTPWKITKQRVYKTLGFLTAKDAVEGGAWATYTSGGAEYVGHQTKQSNSAGNTLTWTEVFKGDVYLGFTGDTDGGIVSVSVNGGTPVLIDTYSATPNDYRRFTIIAQDLREQEYTIVVTTTNSKNPASSGFQANITSLLIAKGDIAPYSRLYQAKPWKPNTVVRPYEEVVGPTGRYYYTVAGGTTGTTGPTHITGTASDGGVDWAITAISSFSASSTTFQTAGSELEYAYEVLPAGESVIQDIGGNVHGHEYVVDMQVQIDGNDYSSVLAVNDVIGSKISLVQRIRDYYGVLGSDEIDVADVIQTHEFNAIATVISHDITFLIDCGIGYFYTAMWPFLTYSAGEYTKNFKEVQTPLDAYQLKDYEGVAGNPILGRAKDFWMEARGRCYIEHGSAGIPTSDNGLTGLVLGLKADIKGLDSYKSSEIRASIAVNANGGSYNGLSSWLSKMYFQRSADSPLESISAGQTISNRNLYYVLINDNNIDVSGL